MTCLLLTVSNSDTFLYNYELIMWKLESSMCKVPHKKYPYFQLGLTAMKTVVMSNSSAAKAGNASLKGGSVTTTKIVKMARTNMTVVSTTHQK